MSIFDLIGAAGAGLTRGMAQGEQAKLQLLRQNRLDTENHDYHNQQLQLQRDQLDLQKLRAQKDAERALGESQDRIRELGIKAAVASLDNYNHPQFAADHDAQAQKAGLESSLQVKGKLVAWLQKAMSGKDAGEFPYPKALQKIAEQEGQAPGQGQQMAPEAGPQPSQQPGQPAQPPLMDILGMMQHVPGLSAFSNPLIQNVDLQAITGPQIEPDTIVQRPQRAPQGFVPQPPKTAADIAYKGAAQGNQDAQAGLAGARTKTEEIKQLNQKKADESLIHQREASATNLLATAKATPQRVSNDTQRTLDSIRKTDETIRNNKTNNELAARRVAVAEQASAVLGELRRMQTVNTGQDAAMTEVKIRRLADSLPPDQAKVLNAYAGKMFAYDQLNSKWVANPEAMDQVQAILQGLGNAPGSAAAGAATGTGGAIQGAPSNATLSTQDAIQSKGPAGTQHTATQGKYKASWQVNRGANGKAPAPSNREIQDAVSNPDVQKKVEQLSSDPAALNEWKSNLSPAGQKAVNIILNNRAKKPKAKPTEKKAKPAAPNLMTVPRR